MNWTLEVVVYWIVVICFALPIALMALLYIWRTFADMLRGPGQHEEDEQSTDEYWKEPEKRHDD